MKNIRWIIILLLVVGYGSVFGQQLDEQSILKKEFTRIQADMIKDVCNIMGYTNQEVIEKLNQTPFSIASFYETFPKNPPRKTIEYCLKNIIGEANDSGKLSYITGSDFSKDYTTINTFRENLINAFKIDNLACYNSKADKEAKISEVQSKSSVWENRINGLKDDYNNYTLAKNAGNWDSYINNSSANKKFIDIAKENKKKNEEREAFQNIQKLSSYADIQQCKSFLDLYPNSEYKSQVEEKKRQLEALIEEKTDKGDNEYDWFGRKLTQSGRYDTIIGGKKYVLNLTIEKTTQVIVPDDKSGKFLKELNKCKSREAIVQLLSKNNNNSDYKEYAENSYWNFCSDSTGWKDYISFYGPEGSHYNEALTNLAEERKPKVQPEEKPITPQPNQTNEGQQEVKPEEPPQPHIDEDNGNSLIWYLIAGVAVVALLLAIILRKRKKNQSQPVSDDKELREENAAFERCSTISACDYYLNTYPNGRFVKEVIAKKERLGDKMQKEEDEAFKACTTVTACDFYLIKYPKGKYVNAVKEKKAKLIEGGNKPKPKDEPENKPKLEPKQKQGEWVVVGASVKGNGHIESNMPCQDSNKFEILGKGWGVAVVSDGAGSAAHSELGSKVVVERGAFHFKNLVEKEGWMEKNTLPSDAEWLQKSYFVLKTIRNEVEMVAKKNNVDLKSLSATCLAVVFSPMGLLAVHVGDGRMGCKTASGGWKAIMTPHTGDEANQTLFLISEFWDIPNYVQSGVLVPESIVVREPVEAFAVMSDGCESTAWLCTAQNAETGKYYDQNKPFEGFFNPLEETLASFHMDNVPEEERKEKWYKFIESGTKGFVKEQDDKTMILGVFL